MKHYIYNLLLLICISTNAQNNVISTVPLIDSTFATKLIGTFFFERRQYIGDQYFNKDWTESDILLSNGEMISGKMLKYNGLFDELVWLNTNNFGKFKLDKSLIKEFWLKNIQESNIHFKRINVIDTSKVFERDIFVEVEVEGKVSLYIQRKISIKSFKGVLVNEVLSKYEVLELTPKYYIKLPSNHYLTFKKLHIRAFLRLFPEKKKAIGKIIRDNHLNIKFESDFVKVIELMNQEAIF